MNSMVIDSSVANKIVANTLEKMIDIVNPQIFSKIIDKNIEYYAVEIIKEENYIRKSRILRISYRNFIDLLGTGLRDDKFKVSNIEVNVKNDKITYRVSYKMMHSHRPNR